MRKLLAISGFAIIAAYAVYGALLANNWAVEAASGIPLDETIVAMSAAGQGYSSRGGWVFACAGIILAISWLLVTLTPKFQLPGWVAAGLWGLIVALGAPTYFFTAFGNINSVGDTFEDWNAGAAFALEAPLYTASILAGVLLAAMAAIGTWSAFSGTSRPLRPTGS
jgi:hypothetical protein